MNPPSIAEHHPADGPVPVLEPAGVPLTVWVRTVLVLIALGLVAVFGLAFWINPYDENGQRRTMETHRQLGLPACTFKVVTGVPCPSCGMTTSFALLVRGDLLGSLYANAAGTLLALCGLLFIPWCLVCVWSRRLWIVRSIEWTFMVLVVGFTLLTVVRWVVVVVLALRPGGTGGGGG